MLGTYDFCGHYEWTFEWLRRQGGDGMVHEYWDEAIHLDSQRHARALILGKGIDGMKEYWGHTLAEEAADYTTAATDDSFRIDMHDCPSKGFLLRNGLEQYPDYCDHCIGWIGPLMKEAGFTIDHEHNHRGQCWWEFRETTARNQAKKPFPVGQLAGASDVRQKPDWNDPTTPIDRFLAANAANEKQPNP